MSREGRFDRGGSCLRRSNDVHVPAEAREILGQSRPSLSPDRTVGREVIGNNQETTRAVAAGYGHVDEMAVPLANSLRGDLFLWRTANTRGMQDTYIWTAECLGSGRVAANYSPECNVVRV